MRVGLHTCTALVGHISTGQAATFNVLGPGPGLAATLARLNGQLHTHVLLSPATHARARDHYDTRGVDRVVLEGGGGPMELHELLREAEAGDEWMYDLQSRREAKSPYDRGWAAFVEGDFRTAHDLFHSHAAAHPEDACAARLRALAGAWASRGRTSYARRIGVPWECTEDQASDWGTDCQLHSPKRLCS